ncbi:Polypeptide-transport-associated domain protein ShlB-type [Gloeothece citriformis PCC 7424]|uniref:Polypeptide-transport-associated domain protein ShlB-type n=1 Tax=Gloeothece citriformis (strain PCC 7424) TaxID=65393 RepID=B7KAW3_GLOC7|nr:ShlB/FhaC/HecB family hemolysin secretion/activation protein [Gloeothece citriformis]ACK70073.1 Polypeptide-transport-associated domain protein ShlB-type [Gloeothece citriformis PCC 7424]
MKTIQLQKKRHWQKGVLVSACLVTMGLISEKTQGLAYAIPGSPDIFRLKNQEKKFSDSIANFPLNSPEIIGQNNNNKTPILIEKVQVEGSTVFTSEDFAPIIQPIEGKTVTQQQLREVVSAITQLYINEGYLNSRAVLVGISDGVAVIAISEGTIGNIEIEGTTRLQNYVRSRIELGIGTPLNARKLEDQLRLLRSDPLFKNVQATLQPPQEDTPVTPGEEKARSTLVVTVTEADPFAGSVGADNYSPPSIGATRFNLNLLYRNLTGIGDQIATSYRPRFETWDGTYSLDLAYRAPLNPMDGAITFNALIERNRVIQGVENIDLLNIGGNSERYTLDYRQPLKRTTREELALSTGFSYYNGRTFLDDEPFPFGFGPNDQGVTITSVFTFGQEYIRRQRTGAWGVRSQFRFGTGLFEATDNNDRIPDGYFFTWLGQVQRLQVINPDNVLIIQLDLQLTPDTLLPSEQFVIGGAQSVRGYRQNVMAGDNGARFSIEDRITLVRDEQENPVFILAPFFDLGAIWNSEDNPNRIVASQTVIAGLGLGVIWQPIEKLNIRLDYAPPLMDLNIRRDNVQDDGFYFSINYGF